jgi:hypothetical protein
VAKSAAIKGRGTAEESERAASHSSHLDRQQELQTIAVRRDNCRDRIIPSCFWRPIGLPISPDFAAQFFTQRQPFFQRPHETLTVSGPVRKRKMHPDF